MVVECLLTANVKEMTVKLACSKRSDSGERCEVKKAMKSRGGLVFIFSRSFLLRTAPHYLNAWNRLLSSQSVTQGQCKYNQYVFLLIFVANTKATTRQSTTCVRYLMTFPFPMFLNDA